MLTKGMTADEIRSLELWTQHFQETMLREIAAQLVEIHELLKQGVVCVSMATPGQSPAAKSKSTRHKGK